MRRCRVEAPLREGATLPLDEETAHHLLRVLRLPAGTLVEAHDPRGQVAIARLVPSGKRDAHLEVIDAPRPGATTPPVHLALGVLKGPAMDDAVRMATEAGVTHLHVVVAERSVPTGERVDRWERIARSACVQAGRPTLPHLHPPGTWDDVLARLTGIDDRRVCLPGAPRGVPARGEVAVVVGPEGGLSPHEEARLLAEGWQPMGLGPWVLRACTAAPVAVALAHPAG